MIDVRPSATATANLDLVILELDGGVIPQLNLLVMVEVAVLRLFMRGVRKYMITIF